VVIIRGMIDGPLILAIGNWNETCTRLFIVKILGVAWLAKSEVFVKILGDMDEIAKRVLYEQKGYSTS